MPNPKNILIIDNNIDRDCWGASDFLRLTHLSPESNFHVRRGPHRDVPQDLAGFDRVIVTGSRTSILEEHPWIDDVCRCLDQALRAKIPILGVCYGHQLLAKTIGGPSCVGRAPIAEIGWIEIEITEENALTWGLPTRFYTYSFHYDEVSSPPAGTIIFAQSEDCAIQGFRIKEQPAFGIQFHPERRPEEAEKIGLDFRKKGKGSLFRNANRGKYLYSPSIGETLFRNFLRL